MLKKPSHLMNVRTSVLISLQNIITHNCVMKLNTSDLKRLSIRKPTFYISRASVSASAANNCMILLDWVIVRTHK